jgi:hypothetical protein
MQDRTPAESTLTSPWHLTDVDADSQGSPAAISETGTGPSSSTSPGAPASGVHPEIAAAARRHTALLARLRMGLALMITSRLASIKS